VKATSQEQIAGPICPRGAKRTLGIVKNPATNIFCYFCMHRNYGLNFFSPAISTASKPCRPA
jgi:hypothetical protein